MRKVLALCDGRHEMPSEVQGSIFNTTLDPLDVEGMERTAEAVLNDTKELVLYVTGLSVALVSVINVCHKKGIKLTLMHFDRSTSDYYPQVVA